MVMNYKIADLIAYSKYRSLVSIVQTVMSKCNLSEAVMLLMGQVLTFS